MTRPRPETDSQDAAKIGHADRVNSFIARIERLEEEKAALAADIREVFAEAKEAGVDTKNMREILKLRKLEQADRRAREHRQ